MPEQQPPRRRTRVAEGIYKDRLGVAATVKVRAVQRDVYAAAESHYMQSTCHGCRLMIDAITIFDGLHQSRSHSRNACIRRVRAFNVLMHIVIRRAAAYARFRS